MYERFRGVGKHYNPELDYKQKIEDLRHEWEEWQASKASEEKADDYAHDDFHDDVSTYFSRTSKTTPGQTPMLEPMEKTEGEKPELPEQQQ